MIPKMQGLADLFFPRTCAGCAQAVRGGMCSGCIAGIPRLGAVGCRCCGRPGVEGDCCRDCRGRGFSFDCARQAVRFDPVVRRAVHRLKYSGQTCLARPLALLAVELVNGGGSVPRFITWIPPSPERLRATGVDHARLIAQTVAGELGVCSGPTLRRVRKRPPQMTLAPQERRLNLQGAFAAPGPVPPVVTVVDDVFTTGSTVSEAGRALKAAGARMVGALCVARSYESL